MGATIDIWRLPPPDAVLQVEYDEIVKDIVDRASLENASPSDPSYRVALSSAYREMFLRQDSNEQARGLMLAYAKGPQLDHLGYTYYRNSDGTPVLRLDGEKDDAFRARLQLSPEGLSVAGPDWAYIYHARSASPDVKAASVNSPAPVQVDVYILAQEGLPSQSLLNQVDAYLWPRRPFTDEVKVKAATLLDFTVNATVYVKPGPSSDVVVETARKRLEAYLEENRKLGGHIHQSSVHWALTVEGIEHVSLENWTDIVALNHQAPNCVSINIKQGAESG
ncbi:baseplate J/gp47 family protein [Vibrio cholerae]|uniref:Baseplate assembly protein n=1 Tax=Vibrio cholerae TaxID=666 RepID=A0A7Z7VK95_VIBCL|nr:baseplate J/gp47 family protein [Vibrio cholerae]TBM39807.1 baseplate assembly protein [Vibrio cholerae]